MFVFFVILFCVFNIQVNAQLHNNNHHHMCGDFHPQMIVNSNQILGRWYATEVIFHDKEELEKIKYHDVCPIIHLSDIVSPAEEYSENINTRNEHQQNIKDENENMEELMKPLVKLWHDTNQNSTKKRWTVAAEDEELNNFKKQALQNLRIVWNEQGTRDEYTLKYNVSKPGYWMSFGPQNTSYQEQHHFVGTVQVLRAVRTHMVLTFCHISYRDQFFSVVLSREPWMEERELHNIHNFLQRKLPIKHVRRMCMDFIQNNASIPHQSVALIIFIFNLVFLFSKYT